MLLKTSFLLPHLFCNVEFELIQLISQHRAVVRETLILKIEMLLELQNTTNFKIIGFFRINAFWIRLRLIRYRFVRYRFVRYRFRFARYRYPQ